MGEGYPHEASTVDVFPKKILFLGRGETEELIAKDRPTLEDLAAGERGKVIARAIVNRLTDDANRRMDALAIDYAEEREKSLAGASRTGSKHTKTRYRQGIAALESWCSDQGVLPLELAPTLADDWITRLRAEGRAPSTITARTAGASAFWTWLERRHTELRNPFRGTKARRVIEVPTDHEIRRIEAGASAGLRAAIVFMSQAGSRVGGLASLSINGERYRCTTKGKEQVGKVPAEARDAIKAAGLSLRGPFAGKDERAIGAAFRYLTKKLHAAGEIKARYSVHDLRHEYAVRLYRSTRDIYAASKVLGHAKVAVTERYLRSIGENV